MMNCKQAKQIKIVDFLHTHEIEPIKIYGQNLWYKAPYREDKKPSFKVNATKNTWYDMTTATGGTIIDLVILMFNSDLSGALAILQKSEISSQSFSFSDKQKNNTASIEIKHVQPLQNRALIQYLQKRKISLEIASGYIEEAYYKVKNKQYFALAFKNDKGGFELRNKYFKGGNSPKYITTIPGDNNSINIFEGFIDFISALTYFEVKTPANKTIILNTTANLPYVENILKSTKEIHSFLDNDKSGSDTLTAIRELNYNVINHSGRIYPGYNDFNDFICNKPLTQ